MQSKTTPYAHPTAIIDPNVEMQDGVKVWHFCHVRSNAVLSKNVSLGRDVFVDEGVQIGENTRVQNGVSIYKGVSLSKYVFVGPHVIFTNDMFPRVSKKNWKIIETILEDGCSVGAGSIIRCGVKIGAFALIGAGSVVTKSVPSFTLVMGLPAVPKARICACGNKQFELSYKMKSPFCPDCKSALPPEMIKIAELEFSKTQRKSKSKK